MDESKESEQDISVTSRNEAEMLSYDRIHPFIWNLRQILEGRITNEWIPGKKIEVVLETEMEVAAGRYLEGHYTNEGWKVTCKGKRADSKLVYFTLE